MKRAHYLALSALVIIADLITKALVSRYVEMHDAITIIPDFFQIVHVRNTGAAFGIGANASSRIVPLLLNVGALGVFCVVVVYAVRSAVTDRIAATRDWYSRKAHDSATPASPSATASMSANHPG